MLLLETVAPVPEHLMTPRLAIAVSTLALTLGLAHARPALAAPPAPGAAAVPKNAQKIEIQVTRAGFVPDEVNAKAGAPIALHVTRKVERTCATEIVLKDFGVNQPLPLDKTVTVVVNPKKPGTYRFACGMDMIAGELRVQ